MNRAVLGNVTLEYELRGSGAAVVFVHHGAGADWFRPLQSEHALDGRYALIHYHRAGYAGSSGLTVPLTFGQEAINLRALLQSLGFEHAHIVGHSASACIALQMALDAADCVHSLALLEPALMAVPSPPEVPRALELYRSGDKQGAVETFLRGTCGVDCVAVLEQSVPGAVTQALSDADTFFSHELPALRQWSFGPDEARRITQPVLAVVGEESDTRFHRRQQLLLQWLPNVEPFMLAGTGHLLHVQNPRGLAEGLAAFFARHPLGVAV